MLMKTYKLGDICTVVSGSTPKTDNPEFWNGDIKWITPAEINKESYIINDTERKITDVAVKKTGLSSFPTGTVLLSSRAPIGKVAIAGCEMYCNQGFKNLICSDAINNKYLYWLLKSKTEFLNSLGRGATFKEISKAIVENIEIRIPDISCQEKAVSQFEAITEAARICQNELNILNESINARFVEMFGDEKNLMPMSDICSIITDGTHQPPKFKDTGIPFIFVSNITGDKVTYDAEKFIDQDTYDELIKRTPIEIGDVLLSTVGSYGHPAVVKSDKKFLFQRHIAYLKPRREIIDSDYLHGAILSPDAQRHIEEGVKGIAQKTLNLSEIKKLQIPVPELNRQKEFSTFVSQVDKSKAVVQSILDKLNTLLASLMQEYFG